MPNKEIIKKDKLQEKYKGAMVKVSTDEIDAMLKEFETLTNFVTPTGDQKSRLNEAHKRFEDRKAKVEKSLKETQNTHLEELENMRKEIVKKLEEAEKFWVERLQENLRICLNDKITILREKITKKDYNQYKKDGNTKVNK